MQPPVPVSLVELGRAVQRTVADVVLCFAVLRIVADAALGRAVEPNEITKTVMFLCSDDASGITGQMLRVCAGAAMS